MTPSPPAGHDLLTELRFALEEGYAEVPPLGLYERIWRSSVDARAPGRPVDAPPSISGAETFRRSVASLESLLGEIHPAKWSLRALRDLDVQGLMGHLIGVEATFIEALSDEPPDDGDHLETTQPYVLAQRGRDHRETWREWQVLSSRTSVIVANQPCERPVAFYGVVLPLDEVLVIRAFEMWTHEEDIRRASGLPFSPPDPEPLARMADLAVKLLPAGIARAGVRRARKVVRVVLTGPAGGTWDIRLDDTPAPTGTVHATITLATEDFCRTVANRMTGDQCPLWLDGDETLAQDLLTAAATLALD